jgi:hypothetical protein
LFGIFSSTIAWRENVEDVSLIRLHTSYNYVNSRVFKY